MFYNICEAEPKRKIPVTLPKTKGLFALFLSPQTWSLPHRIRMACFGTGVCAFVDVISTWKLHSTLAFPSGSLACLLFFQSPTFDGSQMIGKENVTCWSHVCILLWLLRAQSFLWFQSHSHTKVLLRKFIEATFFSLLINTKLGGKRQKKKKKNAPNLQQLYFQKYQNRRKKKGEKILPFTK